MKTLAVTILSLLIGSSTLAEAKDLRYRCLRFNIDEERGEALDLTLQLTGIEFQATSGPLKSVGHGVLDVVGKPQLSGTLRRENLWNHSYLWTGDHYPWTGLRVRGVGLGEERSLGILVQRQTLLFNETTLRTEPVWGSFIPYSCELQSGKIN